MAAKKTSKKKSASGSKAKTTKKKSAKASKSAASKSTKKKTKTTKKAAAKKSSKSSAKKTTKKKTTKAASDKKKTTKKKSETKSKPKASGGKTKTTKRRPVSKGPKPASAAGITFFPTLDPDINIYEELPDEALKKVKTELSRKDLSDFRSLLLHKRAELVGDVESLEEARASSTEAGDISHMPLHMADVGSDNYEQEFTLGLMESERQLLREIDEAIWRIDNSIYGVCVVSGLPIARSRLEAKPWAKYTIEVARERERLGLAV